MVDRSTPPSTSSIGRIVFAVGIAGIGVEDVLHGDFMAGLQPVPAWLPARAALAVVVGVFLIATSAAIAGNRGVRPAARALTALLWLWVAAIFVPRLLVDAWNGGAWTSAFELVALGAAAALLAVPSRPALGRIGFGIALPAFGVLHFIYRDYVASVIPAWIPGHMFWALFTGAAHIAAGVSLLVDRKARLAAILLTVMFGSWVVILHAPRVVERQGAAEWTSLLVATAMCGGSWLLVAACRDREP